MKLNFRHGVISGQVAGTTPDYLAISSTPSAIDLRVAPTPLFVAIAHGTSNYLLKFDETKLAAWANITPGYNYLYIDVDQITGQTSFGVSKLEPVTSAAEPASPVIGQHWFDLQETTMKVRTPDNAKWMKVARVFVGRTIGATQLTPAGFGSTVGLGGPANTGYLVFDSLLRPVRLSSGEILTDASPTRVRMTTGSAGVLTSPLNSFIPVRAVESIPAMSVVYLAGEDSVGLASSNPLLTDAKVPVGIVEGALATNEVGVLTQSGEITHDGWNWAANIGDPLYCGFNGELTTVRPTSVQAYRVGFIKNRNTIIFYVDSETLPQIVSQPGSLIAGQNPIVAQTAVNGIGETVTLISMPEASAATGGYLSQALFTNITSFAARLTTTEADVVALETTKADVVHTHAIADVAGLQVALNAKADLNHTHTEYALSSHTHPNYATVLHSHAISDVANLQAALNDKASLNHAHLIADVTGLQAALDVLAPLSHAHLIADVSGLQNALDGKTNVGHSHVIADIANLQLALDAKADINHTHSAADISDFSEATDDRVAQLLTAGAGITLSYDDVANELTVAATMIPSLDVRGNMLLDVGFNEIYETYTPTTLTMNGDALELTPRIGLADLGAGDLKLSVLNTGTWVNAGTAGGESIMDNETFPVQDVHHITFDSHIIEQQTSLASSPFGLGKLVAVVKQQALVIQGVDNGSPVSATYPRRLTTAPANIATPNQLTFSSDFAVTISGTYGEIATVAMAAQAAPTIAVVDDGGTTLTTAATTIAIGTGLAAENVAPTEVRITARTPSVNFTF